MSLFGILNVNKPKGFTSHDVVGKLRKILNIKQIGHTGTLDPMATGVLPICIGKATKVIQYLDGDKSYRASIKLGVRTDTYDLEGRVIEVDKVKLDIPEIKNALSKFQGNITQKPPIYSAVHYKGKRLYEYARANIAIDDIPERQVSIYSINLIDIVDRESKAPTIVVDIDCSAGTYIRSIANDLGIKLGYGATLAELIRTGSGKFRIENSYTISEIEKIVESGRIEDILINPVCVINLECCKIDDNQLEKIRKGQYISGIDIKDKGEKIQLIYDNKLAAIARVENDLIYPVNVFM